MSSLAVKFDKVHKLAWSVSNILDGLLGAAWYSSRFGRFKYSILQPWKYFLLCETVYGCDSTKVPSHGVQGTFRL